MKRFTVIIPTLQRSPVLWPLVDQFAAHARVGEILIINNASNQLSWSSPKVRILAQTKNIYVNAAWNLGAREAREAYLCISNDDIEFDPRGISFAARILDKGKYSIVGPAKSCLNGPSGRLTHGLSRAPDEPFGTLMFMDAATYVPIPARPLIWGGDDWLFWNRETPAAEIRGLSIKTEMNTSSAAFESLPIRERDWAWWRELVDQGMTNSRLWHEQTRLPDRSGAARVRWVARTVRRRLRRIFP